MTHDKAAPQNNHNSATLRLEWRNASDLKSHPSNWRRHPPAQQRALQDVLAEVGWAGALLFNERTGRLIDGHLRAQVAKGQKVPVLVGEWTEEQERKILATLDPLAAMAQPDQDALLKLLESVQFESADVNAMLEALANGETQPMPVPLNGGQKEATAPTCKCPKCGFEFHP